MYRAPYPPYPYYTTEHNPALSQWSATKRELYGLMWAMQKLRMYLLGRTFIARVDHKPLVAMMQNPLTAIMEGWVDTINQFSFITEYLPGDENVIADALSRCYEERLPSVHLCGATILSVKQELTDEKSDGATATITTTGLDTEQAMQWQAVKRGKRIPSPQESEKIMQQTHALGHFST